MNKDSKIYVAGHRGLVGSAILKKLEADGYSNIVWRTHEELDLIQELEVERFFKEEKPEYVFLAAAKVGGILANNSFPAEFIHENLAIENNVIHQSHLSGVKRLLFLASSCIYPKHCPQPMKEEHLLSGYLEPTNQPYAIAKIAGIEMCRSYNRQYGDHYISVMPTNLYGPNDNFDLETSHVLPALMRKFHLGKLAAGGKWSDIQKDEVRFGKIPGDIMKNLAAISASSGYSIPETLRETLPAAGGRAEITLWGTGEPRREFLHVNDLADGCVFLMNRYQGSGIINVGTGKDATIRELARLVAEVVGFKVGVRFDTTKPDGTPQKLLDVSRMNNLGWRPKINLREGLRSVYQWYLEQQR